MAKEKENGPRINLAFYSDHLEFCRKMAQENHQSVTAYVNELIAAEKAKQNTINAWERNFQAYVAYKKEYAGEPLRKVVYNGTSLGVWCGAQRRAYEKNELSNDEIQKLCDAGFPFFE